VDCQKHIKSKFYQWAISGMQLADMHKDGQAHGYDLFHSLY